MKIFTPAFLVCAFVLATNAGLFAQGQSNGLNGPPESIEARPPLRLRAKPQLLASPSGYTPTQVRHAYGFDQITGNGAGQIIAVVDAYGSSTLQSDLNTFSTRFGLRQTQIAFYYPQGRPTKKDSGWALETSLDVEWAHAIAPGATIAVIVAKSASISNLLACVDYAVKIGAKQISMSWGSSEFSSEVNYDYHFNKAGVSFFASSGDNGSGVIWPAVSPYVVSVGGTTLNLDASGNVTSETAWSGSGGGISLYESRPTYQTGWQSSPNRAVPDVSYDADPNTGFPVYIGNYNGSAGWITVGGTSAGAPQWAALMSLVNAARATSISSPDDAIYSAAGADYANTFRDVSTGSNGGFNAGARYDEVTGLGSPLAGGLVPALQLK